jgi:hypothetical protein
MDLQRKRAAVKAEQALVIVVVVRALKVPTLSHEAVAVGGLLAV